MQKIASAESSPAESIRFEWSRWYMVAGRWSTFDGWARGEFSATLSAVNNHEPIVYKYQQR